MDRELSSLRAQHESASSRAAELDKEETNLSFELVKLRQRIKYENEAASAKVIGLLSAY